MGLFDKTETNDKWKEKYLSLLETQEQEAQTQKELETLLCSTIIKLSFAASGFDPALDPHLQRIRNHLKKGINNQALKDELENFSNALSRLSQEPVSAKSSDSALLFDFLLQQYTSTELRQTLQKIKLKSAENRFAGSNELIKEIIAAIDSEATKISHHVPAENSAVSASIDTDTVSRQLLHLFENMEIPAVFEAQVQSVKQSLASKHSIAAFEKVLESAVNLLLKIKQHLQTEQQDIDKFLSRITQQLTELEMAVTGASTAANESAISRNKMTQSVSEQMKALQLSSYTATKLEPLKEIINQKLEEVTKEIQEHNQEEAVRRQKTQQELEKLTEKVKAMESESNDLKLKLKIANSKALRDSLTGLPNRLAYQERLQTELCRWRRYHSPLTMIIWDVDHFKSINDRFGHKAGDKALALIAKQLTSHCRESDFLSRFGGEEFIMLLPDTAKEPALKLADHLRKIIEKTDFKSNGLAITITLSCGITEFIQNDSHESAFDRADRALYQAKQEGRNRCCIN